MASSDLLPTIERAIARQDALRNRQNELDLLRARVASLTPRERQVFGLMVQGKVNKQIAFVLGQVIRPQSWLRLAIRAWPKSEYVSRCNGRVIDDDSGRFRASFGSLSGHIIKGRHCHLCDRGDIVEQPKQPNTHRNSLRGLQDAT